MLSCSKAYAKIITILLSLIREAKKDTQSESCGLSSRRVCLVHVADFVFSRMMARQIHYDLIRSPHCLVAHKVVSNCEQKHMSVVSLQLCAF